MVCVTDMRLLGMLMLQTLFDTRLVRACTIRCTCGRRRRADWCARAAIRKSWLKHKRFPYISRERFAKSIDLLLHICHWPQARALLQYPHVPREVFTSISIEVRIWGRECNLSKLIIEQTLDLKLYTDQVKNSASQDAVNGEVNAALH
jgi:hypothetical protein